MTSRQSKKGSGSLLDSQEVAREQKRKMSDPDIVYVGDSKTRSQPIAIPSAAVSPIVSPHTDGKFLHCIEKIKEILSHYGFRIF